jgi:heme/copper-type cytochrome/quinol oxidase subunit 2
MIEEHFENILKVFDFHIWHIYFFYPIYSFFLNPEMGFRCLAPVTATASHALELLLLMMIVIIVIITVIIILAVISTVQCDTDG